VCRDAERNTTANRGGDEVHEELGRQRSDINRPEREARRRLPGKSERVKSLLGVLSILDGGKISANSTWQPSARLGLLLTNLTGILATDSVSFQFVPSGTASWRIDDVYLDPWKNG
jgi:hypothetical protein